ncbi:putative reverse transcriptase domain-containing protein [Tanacetum coccineum]
MVNNSGQNFRSCSTEYILMIKIGFDIILEPKVKFNESSFWKIQPHVNWRSGRIIFMILATSRIFSEFSELSKLGFYTSTFQRSCVEGVILCLRVLSLRCLLVKGAYGCILGQTVTIVGQQQQLLHLSKLTLRGNDARTFELVQIYVKIFLGKRELELELETRQKEGLENGVGTVKLKGLDHLANIRKEKFTFSMPTFPGKHPSLTIQLLFVDEALEIPYSYWDGAGHRQVMRVILSGVEGVILCLRVLSLRCLLVKGAYGCILGTLFRSVQMVNTRQSTPEFSGPAFDEAVQRAVNALLPGLTTQFTNELRQNGAGGSGEQPPTIHTWLERFGKQKPRSFSSATTLVDAENWIVHIEKLFEVLGCVDEFKARLASYKLEGDALNWWKAFKQAKGCETYVATLSWKDFRDIFFLQYFPRSEQQKYEREYHMIRQRDGEPSGEFMERFLRLVGFLGKKAGTQEELTKNFKWALCELNHKIIKRKPNSHRMDINTHQ